MLKNQKNNPLSVCLIAVWAYAQSLFERTHKDPKNDIFVVHFNTYQKFSQYLGKLLNFYETACIKPIYKQMIKNLLSISLFQQYRVNI